VIPSDAPAKKAVKRIGEIEGAVLEFLATQKVGIKIPSLTKHFVDRYQRNNVNRAINSLAAAQFIHKAAGMVCIAEVAK